MNAAIPCAVRFGSGRNKFVQLLIRSWNSNGRFVRSLLGTVHSETVATVSLSALLTVPCNERIPRQLERSGSGSHDIHLFNNPSLNTTEIRHRHWHRVGMSRKTLLPTELQIPATVTTLVTSN